MPDEKATPRVIRIPASDGLTLNALEWSSEGVPLLLLHGFSNEAHIWDDFAPEVASYYRTIAIDQRGHGDSDWHPEGDYEMDRLVDDLEVLIDHFGFDRLVLCGHSLGGRVSMLYAGRHPEKLAGLVIVDTGPEHDPRGTLRIQMDVGQHPDPSFASVEEYAEMCARLYVSATPEAIRRMAQYGVKQGDDGRYKLKMDPAIRGFGTRGRDDAAGRQEYDRAFGERAWAILEKLPCPTLVVRGAASDVLSAETADRMVDDVLPSGQLAVVARASHSVMTDNPRGFRDAVCGFVLGE